ncbi:MAG: molybdenum cofactor guanylyltransferase [Candidatus Freyarchaeota archaeon]
MCRQPGAYLLRTSAIVLAGGSSKRLSRDKALTNLAGKPLILHVLHRIRGTTNEVLVVVSSKDQKRMLSRVLEGEAEIVVDKSEVQSPLVGAISGFENVGGEYSLLLPCDTPFVSREVISLLLDVCTNRNAVIPKWPNGYIEPLQAVYRTESALMAAKTALKQRRMNLRSMISRMGMVRYISTLALRWLDPTLLTFFNVNTLEDLRKAESILRRSSKQVSF